MVHARGGECRADLLPLPSVDQLVVLRREEVASLANVSVTYYTYLEQGRPVRPSVQVLDALASALRMSAAERRYLHVLAYGPGGGDGAGLGGLGGAGAVGGAGAEGTVGGAGAVGAEGGTGAASVQGAAERLDPAVADLVQWLEPSPAVVKGRRWDILAANPAARELFAGWGAGSAGSAGPEAVRGLMAMAASWPSARVDFERVSNRICHLISAQSAATRVHWDVIVCT
ncbi:MAG TPA: helix-turn-helix domain-containing protein [Trebonia sp.]